MDPLTTDMILVMSMIALAIFLFIVEWIRVDVVAAGGAGRVKITFL